jgi:hypothetical protein
LPADRKWSLQAMGRGPRTMAGTYRPSRHEPLTGMQKVGGTIAPAPPSMQKRNTGMADAGCVCLLQAPGEGNGGRALPSRFGIKSLSVQSQVRQRALLSRARVLYSEDRRDHADCTSLANVSITLTAQPLRAGE